MNPPLTRNTEDRIIRRALAILEDRKKGREKFESPQKAREYLTLKLSTYEHEVFVVLFLNTRHEVISMQEMFRGSVDACTVHPREVAKEALKRNAAAVILFHAHPSGDVTPSQADRVLTKRLQEALQLFDIRVLDHFVCGAGISYSFAENGLI